MTQRTMHARRPAFALLVAMIAAMSAAATVAGCSGGGKKTTPPPSPTTNAPTSTPAGTATTVPTGPRTPAFGAAGQEAPIVKVLPSLDPTVILQFPLVPASIKTLFPDAGALVTVVEGNPADSGVDTVTVNVKGMPPNVKFTVFFTELAAKPFGHAEYVGDVFVRGDGTGEGVYHAITLGAFAADHRTPVTSMDQTGPSSGIALEHVGMWFDNLGVAQTTLKDPSVTGTPFDGGPGPIHAGPQAMTDGQDLPVI